MPLTVSLIWWMVTVTALLTKKNSSQASDRCLLHKNQWIDSQYPMDVSRLKPCSLVWMPTTSSVSTSVMSSPLLCLRWDKSCKWPKSTRHHSLRPCQRWLETWHSISCVRQMSIRMVSLSLWSCKGWPLMTLSPTFCSKICLTLPQTSWINIGKSLQRQLLMLGVQMLAACQALARLAQRCRKLVHSAKIWTMTWLICRATQGRACRRMQSVRLTLTIRISQNLPPAKTPLLLNNHHLHE